MVLKWLKHPATPFTLTLLLAWGTSVVFWERADAYAAFTYGPLTTILLVAGVLYGVLRKHTRRWHARVLWFSFAIVALNAPGSIHFHQVSGQYDRFLHFGVAFFAYLIVRAILDPRWEGKRRNVSLVIAVAGLFLFEVWQWLGDQFFAAHSFLDRFQSLPRDVTEDILFGFLGILTARAYRRRKGRS